MKELTFKQARTIIMERLKVEGWRVSDHLKVPHAKSPLGGIQVWLKAESIHGARAGSKLGDARSLAVDTKALAAYLAKLPAADQRIALTDFLTNRTMRLTR